MSARDRCLQDFEAFLKGRTWQSGDRLPPEVELAERFSVARETLRWAINTLIQRGTLRRIPGHGRKSRGLEVASTVMRPTVRVITIVSQFHADGLTREVSGQEQTQALYWADIELIRQLDAKGLAWEVLSLSDLAHEDVIRAALTRSAALVISVTAEAASLALAQRAGRLGIPVVVGSGDLAYAGCDRVFHDHRLGSIQITKWLLRQGATRIRMVQFSDERPWWMQARNEGYSRALIESGLSPMPVAVIHATLPVEWSQTEFERCARQSIGFILDCVTGPLPAHALIVPNDWMAMVVARAVRLAHLVPHQDVLIAGYDNTSNNVLREWEPSIPAVTIDQDWAQLGRTLAQVVADRLAGRLPAKRSAIDLPPTLVVPHERGS